MRKKGLLGLVLSTMLLISGCSLGSKKDDGGITGVYEFDRIEVLDEDMPGEVSKTVACNSVERENAILKQYCYAGDTVLYKMKFELKDNYEAIVTSYSDDKAHIAKVNYGIGEYGQVIMQYFNEDKDNSIIFIRGNELVLVNNNRIVSEVDGKQSVSYVYSNVVFTKK